MFISEFNDSLVTQYMYSDKSRVPIIDTIELNDFTYGRLDIILNKYYRNRMDYIKLFYDFNEITDPTDLYIGRLIDIPDFDALLSSMSVCNIFTDEENIPGVNSSMISSVNSAKPTNNKTFTTAIPKMNLRLRNVSYDSKTGIIKY